MSATDALLDRVRGRIDKTRHLRDNYGWPEPRTLADLRTDPRVQLRNDPTGQDRENLELAAALILLVAEDRFECGD